jgi:molecular chaperone DnaK
MHIGIDLGTTFCCAAFIDEDGVPKIIPNSDNGLTTPSVIWFDGRNAYVGKKANDRKELGANQPIYEFIKLDMGKPATIPADLYPEDDPHAPRPAAYEVKGFRYGADGMSAIILRKLKKDTIRYLKRIKKFDEGIDEKSAKLDAVITVPHYFRDKERQMTQSAGYCAGMNVIGIINEPTAAALAYGLTKRENMKIMVFDLGGGTLDVTLLETKGDECNVIASDGARELGGKDWDVVIQRYIYSEFERRNRRKIPEEKGFEIQKKALEAKFDLSENEQTTVSVSTEEGDTDIVLYRSAPEDKSALATDEERPFYFDEQSVKLIHRCRTICKRVMEDSGLEWGNIDEILLAGGACRMPMIPRMLEELTGKKIKRDLEGFSYDTAIAIGAALYGEQKGRVKDVVSHSIGVKVDRDGRDVIDFLIKKDTHLPASAKKGYVGGPGTVVEVYEGEFTHPGECVCRGRIPLKDIDGDVTVIMELDEHNVLKVIADYPPHRVEKKFEGEEIDDRRLKKLKEMVRSIVLNL